MVVIKIRPNSAFKLCDRVGDCDPLYFSLLMPNKDTFSGGLKLLESAALLSLVINSNASKIFEFGTYMGGTTELFRRNLISAKEIASIDINEDFIVSSLEVDSDRRLAEKSLKSSAKYLDTSDSRVNLIKGDSTKYDFSELSDYDFVWIDGGHNRTIVESDTKNSFIMINRQNPRATIAWHDYGNPEFNGLSKYIDELSDDIKIYHIEETYICFHFPNKDAEIPYSSAR